MKKLILILISVVLLSGCHRSSNTEPNAKRGTDYEFDIVNFLNIETFGENGNGYLKVTAKEFTVDDFYNEADYINVKKDIDNINPFIIPDYNASIKASKTTGLSNGDVVKLKFDFPLDRLNSEMNIEDYEYVVADLGDVNHLDLYSEDKVTFFASEDGKLHAHKENSSELSEEMKEHLNYYVETKDDIEVGRTVMSITAEMDKDFLIENEYYSTAVYLAKNGLGAELSSEKVLRTIVEPIQFHEVSVSLVENSLYEALQKAYNDEEQDVEVLGIQNIQQTSKQSTNERYTYVVVYTAVEDGETKYFYRTLEMYRVEGGMLVENLSRPNETKEEYAKEAMRDSKILLQIAK